MKNIFITVKVKSTSETLIDRLPYVDNSSSALESKMQFYSTLKSFVNNKVNEYGYGLKSVDVFIHDDLYHKVNIIRLTLPENKSLYEEWKSIPLSKRKYMKLFEYKGKLVLKDYRTL